MYYRLVPSQEVLLLNQPETGMGYQIVEAVRVGNYTREKFLVLNSEIVFELNGFEDQFVRFILSGGIGTLERKQAC